MDSLCHATSATPPCSPKTSCDHPKNCIKVHLKRIFAKFIKCDLFAVFWLYIMQAINIYIIYISHPSPPKPSSPPGGGFPWHLHMFGHGVKGLHDNTGHEEMFRTTLGRVGKQLNHENKTSTTRKVDGDRHSHVLVYHSPLRIVTFWGLRHLLSQRCMTFPYTD